MLLLNVDRSADARALDPMLGRAAGPAVAEVFSALLDYRPTPLLSLPAAARGFGLGAVFVKDEGNRLGLTSFKALGGAYAVIQHVRAAASHQLGRPIGLHELPRPASGSLAPPPGSGHDRPGAAAVRDAAAGLTFACATDGNHGQSVAAGARLMGAKAVIFVHHGVSGERRAAIARFGATIEVVQGSYDEAVAESRRRCEAEGWTLVSDTARPGHEDTPRQVMQGYTLIAHEISSQLPSAPTHVFLQAGVGGLAAALASAWTDIYATTAPRIIIVEPARAACLLASARAGRLTSIEPGAPTVMSMLECYEPSSVAWQILQRLATAFMTVEEPAAAEAMTTLAYPRGGDPQIIAGESGAAGFAGLLTVCNDPSARAALGLDAAARVLLVNTETATDAASYARAVGATPTQLRAAA